jgi:hypothetical protein
MYIGCMKNTADVLTTEEVAALSGAAKYFGRRWKMELRDCWMRADYPYGLDSGALQSLRNSEAFGPRGLNGYRLPKEDK